MPALSIVLLALASSTLPANGQPLLCSSLNGCNLHFQTTVVDQGHSRFRALYTGPMSMDPNPESANSVTATLFLGLRALKGTELYVDPELAGGRGISGATGLAGVTNGETFRTGSPQPVISTARLFVRQLLALGSETEKVEDGPNQIAGERPVRRVTVTAGKFSMGDLFDNNAYSHDPRSQFMNWALMDSAAWDYPADTRGYTWGAAVEYHEPRFDLRAAAAAVPRSANGIDLDRRIGRAHGLMLEGERRHELAGHAGSVRLLAYLNEARMGSYAETLASPALNNDVTLDRAYGRTKYGFAVSADQELSEDFGAFTRLSWSDGRNETWAFTEVDRSAAVGLDFKPKRLGRADDEAGAAVVVNGLSSDHRRYLAAGGQGFLLGDGALHYGPEAIAELYYRVQLLAQLQVSPDAQLVVNPGYNRTRGPVPIWGLRVHAQF